MAELRMPSINRLHVVGTVVAEPQFREVGSGSLLRGRIAVNYHRKNAAGEWIQQSSYFNFSIWGTTAEHAFNYLGRGSAVYLSGPIRSFSWTDEAGETHHDVEIIAKEFQVLEQDRISDGEVRTDDDSHLPDAELNE